MSIATNIRSRLPSGIRLREWRDGWLLASPFVLGVLVLWVGPMLYSLFLTTQEWDMLSPPNWAGLGNFRRLVADPLVGKSLMVTAYYTFLSAPFQLAVSFSLALALNQGLRGQSVYRTAFYIPAITPAVASAAVWTQIFNPEFGILNQFLGLFGVDPVKWLFVPEAAIPSFIFMSLWSVGPQVVILLAALQNVPQVLLEASEIDGAGVWARFRHVTIPMISPAILFNLIIGIIASFQVFTASFIMTRGGPQNATLFMVLYIYENGFQLFRMGYAALLSWLLFVVILVFTALQFRLSRPWVYYEAGD